MSADRSSSFADRVRMYHTECAPNYPCPTRIASMQEAANGVIITDDDDGEFTVFFDQEFWQFGDPALWTLPYGVTRGPDLDNLGIGLLEGCGLTFKGSYANAFGYAKRHLVSTTEQWYDAPKPIEFKAPWIIS